MRYHETMLSFEICNAARLRRDPRYDGRFFTAVKTTGIYCRPVCLAKHPLTRNVAYYATAAAAEAAGFRPCLRCRPETAPFCPAWNGTRSTKSPW
jgi:AraC family transcriptional regulator of adaptative response/methylated-DNA-[protein]-cysteine methyltransferase